MNNPTVNAGQHPPSGTVTFLFTDIEGSTKLARAHPESWETARARHHAILKSAIESNQGFVFQIIGDAFCAAFHTAAGTVKAAIQAQQEFQKEPWGDVVIRVRMGIHTGEAQAHESEYHGYLAMSLVQRLMSVGHGGQILLSDTTEKLLREQLSKDISLRDMGEHKFKDVPHLVRVFQVCGPELANEFPSLRTLETHPNNLPTQLNSFVGREKELADVKRLLQNAHMLTLIGPGGTGKTRLSIQAAREMLDQYPDGTWEVELAPVLDPLLVPRTAAIAVGLRDEPQRPVIDMLCDYLHEKRMLILLDNCEHLVDACAQMADRILHAAPGVRILASSRESLGIGGEVSYRVPSLGIPDVSHLPSIESLSQYEAVRLFIDRATSAVSSFVVTNENAPSLAQICHRLDGIPLAIELAAAKVRVLPVEQIARRLDDRFKLLTGGSRTALERHQTLRAAIDWSYNLLPVDEQILFRRLSVFVGGWTLEATESICSDTFIQRDQVLDLLEHLINKSIVVLQETRYSMLETLRQYANEKMVEAGESDLLRDRHLDYFLNLAETAEPHLIRPEQLEWLAQLDVDYENIRIALEWALNQEAAEPSLRLCAALGWYWGLRGHWREGTRWLDQVLAKSVDGPMAENTAYVRALYRDAALANDLDDLDRMQSSAEKSLSLAEKEADPRDRAIARFYAGWARDRQFDYEGAIPLMQESLKEFQELKEMYWESVAYRWLGNILVQRGQLALMEKVQYHLELARKAGERENIGEALINRAWLLYQNNDVEAAEKCALEARPLLEKVGSSFNELDLLFASLAWQRGDYQRAREGYLASKERCKFLGDRNMKSAASADLGLMELQLGNLEQAKIYLEESLVTARELVNRTSIVWRLADLGNLFYQQGKKEEFKQSYRESLHTVRDLNVNVKRGLLLTVLDSLHALQPENTTRLLGALYRFEVDSGIPIHPHSKRSYERAKTHTRTVLGDVSYETLFLEGYKTTLDEALDSASKMVEEME